MLKLQALVKQFARFRPGHTILLAIGAPAARHTPDNGTSSLPPKNMATFLQGKLWTVSLPVPVPWNPQVWAQCGRKVTRNHIDERLFINRA
jgi:hypothetical protein